MTYNQGIATQGTDRWVLGAALALTCIGVLMIYSATSLMSYSGVKRAVSEFHYLKRHLFSLVIALGALVVAWQVKLEFLKKLAVPLLIVAFVLLLLVFVPGMGVTVGGARRWIKLWPTVFQPSELVKLAMVIFLAKYLARAEEVGSALELSRLSSPPPSSYWKRYIEGFMEYALPLVILGGFAVVFLMQPDFGATMSLGVITLSMLFLGGMRVRHLALLVVLALPVVAKLLTEPYRFKRLMAFMDPWKYQQDIGFQLCQSFIAFGSGGLTGVGLGRSSQGLGFLPEAHTDFIFSLVGEELGYFAALFIVVLFATIFMRGVLVASRAQDRFAYYLAFGLSLMIALQSLVNFAVVTGLAPTKGLPLPFLSYGGSALLVNMVAIGLVLNSSRPQESKPAYEAALRERMRLKRAKRSVYGVIR